jgi:ABC-type glycerol-3-phosphate transport system permease component
MKTSGARGVLHALRILFMSIYAAFIFLPFLWMFSNAFKPNDRVMADLTPLSIWTFVPRPFTVQPVLDLFAGGLGRSILVTVIVAGFTILGGILINSMAGFSFAKFRFPGKEAFFALVVVSFLIPFEAIAVPLFVTIQRLGWMNTVYALIIPALANGLCIFMFRQFFMDLPDELVDAALIDGAGWTRIYSSLFMPLSRSACITAGFLLFLSQWQAFIWPLLVASSKDLRMVQVLIAFLTKEEFRVFWNKTAAAGFIVALVPLLVILPFQKYFVRGITMTGIKG